MQRIMCKSKIKNAVISDKNMHYDGSIGIDKALVDAADLFPGEQVHVLNMMNGERLITYVVEEAANSGKISLYGPAARLGEPGDEVVILAYCGLDTEKCRGFKMRVVSLGKNNKYAS